MGEADSYMGQDGQRHAPLYGQQQQQQGYDYQQQQGYYQQPQQQQGYYQQQPPQQQDYHGQNAPYPQPTYGAPPPYSFNPPQAHDTKYSFDEAFKVQRPKYNDLWAGILFLLVFAGYAVVSAIAIRGYVNGNHGTGVQKNGGNAFSLDSNIMILFACVLALAFFFSYAYVWLARLFPKQFIWITGVLNICWALGTAIFYFYKKYWSAAIVFLIFAALAAFAFYTWIRRIPFSALMLKTSITVSKTYGHVYLVSLLGGLLATALGAWFSVTLVALYVKYEPSPDNPSSSQAKLIGLLVFVTFAMYWISEWLKNTVYSIIAGVYGSCFGSISLGSLLVAIVQFLRQLCSVARSQAGSEGGVGGMIGYAVFCVLGCLLGLLEWAVEFLNRYAFCHISLYGKAYFPAAKDTWRMIKDRGVDALITECLIGPVLSFGALFVGLVCGLFAYLYLLFTNPSYNANGGFTPVVMAFGFLIGFQIAHIFTTPLGAGSDALFVGIGWDPQVLVNDHPELYQDMVRVYPKVQQAIQVRR